ncbi:MAG TPA: alpha/beta hydrolase [Acidimicrobiales bacterium]|nr:alpha/beta hydrolase [Acidimicrobiales bacterium]
MTTIAALVGTATLTEAVATPKLAGASYAVVTESNLCYQSAHRSCVDGTYHEMDAYLPSGAVGKAPGVILVHGGGFVGGDKSEFSRQAMTLAANGLAAFSVNYRLTTPTFVGFPALVQDVMAAVSYVRAHARTFHVDPHRLGLWGSSAGAYLALESALEAFQNEPSAQVKAVVGWSGPYDFVTGFPEEEPVVPLQVSYGDEYLGCSDLSNPTCLATAESASPTSWVAAGDPPTLLANSTDFSPTCEIVDPAQATELAGDLTRVGTSVTVDLNSECAHALAYTNVEMPNTLTFLEAHLFVAPTITSSPSATFRIGRMKTFTVRSHGSPHATLTESGALPMGVTFVDQHDGRAKLAGTAQAGTTGTYPIAITASNGGSPNAMQRFTLTVR